MQTQIQFLFFLENPIVVDPHHIDADLNSTYLLDVDPDADPDSEFYLMRIRIQLFTMMRIRIQILASK